MPRGKVSPHHASILEEVLVFSVASWFGNAGAVAVELMACTLQHPLGINAPAAVAGERVDHEELPLGPVPHMIRGQLSGFTQMCLTGQAFRQCTACSQTVVNQYRQSGWSFLWQALQVIGRAAAVKTGQSMNVVAPPVWLDPAVQLLMLICWLYRH